MTSKVMQIQKENMIENSIQEIVETEMELKQAESIDIEKEFESLDTSCNMTDILTEYLHSIGKYKVLTREEEIELFKRYEDGDKEAFDIIFEHNLKLVVSIAKRFWGSTKTMTQMDIIMEGNIGLITAINMFDYKRGYRFSTYATHWIRQSITRSISNDDNIIRMPVHIYEMQMKYYKFVTKYEKEHSREPEDDVILHELCIDKDQLRDIRNINANIKGIRSLNEAVGEEEHGVETELMEMLADTKSEDVFALIEQQELNTIFNQMIDRWLESGNLKNKERNRKIIERRFGLNGGNPETLESIASSMDLTRERVRQIEEKFIRYARSPRNKRKLLDYR